MQSFTRMFVERRKVGEKAIAKNLFIGGSLLLRLQINDWWRDYCAAKIQSWLRMNRVMRNFRIIRQAKERNNSALKIQCQVRRCL